MTGKEEEAADGEEGEREKPNAWKELRCSSVNKTNVKLPAA